MCLGLATAACPAAADIAVGAVASTPPPYAGSIVSSEVKRVANWVVASDDNGGLPFLIVDKVVAALFLFDAGGAVVASTPVLLGLAHGDDSPPGIGTRALSSIAPTERITPAGRFVLEAGENLAGTGIIWIDYDAALSLHRASDRKPGMSTKSRVDRLSSASVAERRVSFGCVNVSTAFYDSFIQPTFGHTPGVAYILPETRSASIQFNISEASAPQSIVGGP